MIAAALYITFSKKIMMHGHYLFCSIFSLILVTFLPIKFSLFSNFYVVHDIFQDLIVRGDKKIPLYRWGSHFFIFITRFVLFYEYSSHVSLVLQ